MHTTESGLPAAFLVDLEDRNSFFSSHKCEPEPHEGSRDVTFGSVLSLMPYEDKVAFYLIRPESNGF